MKRAMSHGKYLAMLMALVISASGPFAQAATDPYLKIAEGDSRAKVVRLLGEPADPRKDLNAAERKNIKAALKITDHKDSVDFAVWKRSSHLYYLIGFNKKDAVAAKHRLLTLAGAE